MTHRHDYEALFVDNLAYIERTIAAVTRVLAFRGDDAEEFASWARTRLLDDDYELLRKWRGESKLTTYLGVVLTNLGREFRVRRWGRWRPSAAARHLGPLAVRLESLVHRDGLRLAEAAELLRTRGETDRSDRELADLLARLPARARVRQADDRDGTVDAIPADDGASADADAADDEAAHVREDAYRVLREAVHSLAPDERVVLTMHYLGGRSLADVARAIAVPQKPLYRLRDGALRRLRTRLEASGVTWERVQDFLGGPLPAPDGADTRDFAEARPSRTAAGAPPQSLRHPERLAP